MVQQGTAIRQTEIEWKDATARNIQNVRRYLDLLMIQVARGTPNFELAAGYAENGRRAMRAIEYWTEKQNWDQKETQSR